MGHNQSLKFSRGKHVPFPTGPYRNVGIRDIMLQNEGSGVFLRLYYPANDQSTPINSQYFSWPNWLPHENYKKGYLDSLSYRYKPFSKIVSMCLKESYVPAIIEAPPLRKSGLKFPVIVFSHGNGCCRTTYSSICLEITSYGYIIAAVEHRDRSACCTFYPEKINIPLSDSTENVCTIDNVNKQWYQSFEELGEDEVDDPNYIPPRALENSQMIPHYGIKWITFRKMIEEKYNFRFKQVHYRVKECTRALDVLEALNAGFEIQNLLGNLMDPSEFEDILDMEKCSIMGHHLGGATVPLVLATELRFKFGICLDIWMFPIERESFELINQPMLFINSEKFHSGDNLRRIRELLTSSQSPKSYKGIAETETDGLAFSSMKFDFENDQRILTIKKTCYLNLTDFPFVLNLAGRLVINAKSSRNMFTAHYLITALVIEFMSKITGIPVPGNIKHYLETNREKVKIGISNSI